MDIHSQGAPAEVQRGWSNLCCLPNGRNQASSLPDLKNHPKVKYPTLFPGLTPIPPSPDWIVGVSMENLCLANGSWVDSRVVDLYPWDAGDQQVFLDLRLNFEKSGTNSGLGYHDHGNKTIPREAIHR